MRRPAKSPVRGRTKRPTYTPATNAVTMEDLLGGATNRLALSLISEPALIFANQQVCEDPKTGLTAFGPYSKTDVTRKAIIRIGVVGPAEAIDRALQLIERMGSPIPFSEKLDAMLHPGFPGLS